MLFNSIEFLIFFPAVFALYYMAPHKRRWFVLLVASYFFYGSWNPAYLILIAFSTLVDYFMGMKMGEKKEKIDRRPYLYISLLMNLGLLFSFKYLGFFTNSLNGLLGFAGSDALFPVYSLLLPVGISFYTFQTLSYSIDVYNGELKPTKHLGRFALFVSFFPQLVAGPIERSTNLLPQFSCKIDFDYRRAVDGLALMLWGFFKKIVVADRLAALVNTVYNDPTSFGGLALIVATVFFAFQIYTDFSGYSDIAIGAAMILGFDLMQNFRRPYHSRSVSEFWRRWHISLSSWFRDYVYIPLGGSRTVKWRWYYNLFITFLVSGLWHGANWTFVVWGALHGSYLILSIVSEKYRDKLKEYLGIKQGFALDSAIKLLFTFVLVNFAWIFFRANSIGDALYIVQNLGSGLGKDVLAVSGNFSKLANLMDADLLELYLGFFFIGFMEFIHLVERPGDIRHFMRSKSRTVRWSYYYVLLFFILFFGVYEETQFIYFQF